MIDDIEGAEIHYDSMKAKKKSKETIIVRKQFLMILKYAISFSGDKTLYKFYKPLISYFRAKQQS